MAIEGWKHKKLGELTDLIRNGYSGLQVNRITDYPVTRIETISDGVIDFDKVGFAVVVPDLYELQDNDILISNINSLKHIGKIAQFDGQKKLYHGMNLLLLRFKTEVNNKFIYYSLIASKKWFEKVATQAINQASINQETIKELIIKLPEDIQEQEKIAEVLSTIDRAIAQTEAIIAKQQGIKTGLMQDLLTKGIDENGNIRSEATHEFKNSAIGRIPVVWDVCALGEKTRIRSGSTPSRSNQKFWDEGLIPWVKTSEVNFSEITDTEERITESALHLRALNIEPIDTVLVAMYGQGQTRGRCAILNLEATTNQACAAIFGNLGQVFQKYLFYYLSSQYNELRNVGHGSNQTNLSGKLLALFLIKLPTYEEQLRIANLLTQIDIQISQRQRALKKLKLTKTGLMQDLLTGKVRVINLIKEREPASL